MAQLQTNVQVSVTVSAAARTRTNLALHHLFAACRFAARVHEVEQQHTGHEFGAFWEEILHNALGVATLTVASLESYANEMYFEGSILGGALTPVAADELVRLIDREPVLRKYSMALALRAGKKLDYGDTPVQNIDALIRLRNAVIHFRPEWFDEQDKHDKLSKLLRQRFEPSAFLSNEPMFPRAWASASFASWALRSTVAFLEHFYTEVDVPCPVDQFKATLDALSNNAL